MRGRLGRLAALSALALLGCSAPETAESGATGLYTEAIVNGELSGDDQNSVVLIYNNLLSTWCTGAVVAPTLVLTARHCLFNYKSGPNNIVKCDEQGSVSQVYDSFDPALLTVSIGKERGPNLVPEAIGVDIYSSDDLDLCLNDVALLEVDTPLSQPIVSMRLDEPPRVGERGVLVGWGANEGDVDSKRPPLSKRRQRELEVLAVGPKNFSPDGGTARYIEKATFIATEGGCQGDSGGPLISTETSAVFGVMHAMQTADPTQGLESDIPIADCLGGFTVLHRLDEQAEWIRSAFRKLGAAPWIENRPLPRELGESCELGDDCVSGLCIRAGESAFCSVHCDDAACPNGMQCVGAEFDRVCTLPEVASAESSSGGCALVSGSSSNAGATAALLASLGVAVFARRRRRNRPLQALPDSV
ncbi:MAG: trypsin-like serine protease [Myxococcota bacterium]|nr:trypsin-like serine protease [Myxococcota bacterium]